MGTHMRVLSKSDPIQKSLRHCASGESNLSMGRVKFLNKAWPLPYRSIALLEKFEKDTDESCFLGFDQHFSFKYFLEMCFLTH